MLPLQLVSRLPRATSISEKHDKLTYARKAHGDTNVKDDAVTVDAISEALYSGWAITKRDAKEAKEDAVTVDDISEALYIGWAITKRDDEE